MEHALLALTDHEKQVGIRLEKAINALGITKVDAGKIMGISKSNVGNWCRGEGQVKAYMLYRFCKITGVTADYILLDDPSGLPQRILQKLLEEEREPQPAA